MSPATAHTPLANQKILITGSRGFLGRYLIQELKKYASHIYTFDRDIRTIRNYNKRVDLVYHLAALTREMPPNPSLNFFDVNVTGTEAVLRYCLRSGARCIFASSAAIYLPHPRATPLAETAVLQPQNSYGKSKKIAEEICQFFSHQMGVPVTILRIFNLYGPHQKEDFLIPYLITAISKGHPVTLKTPHAIRDFIHILDAASAFRMSAEKAPTGFRVFNVGYGMGHSIYHVAQKISRALNKEMDVRLCQSSIKNSVISDNSAIFKALSWKPSISLREGIRLILS